MVIGEIEQSLANELCIGVDEAGRGPLAGPVMVAAVCLPPDCAIGGLNDSKKLSESKREALFPQIKDAALAYHVCDVPGTEIDRLNIRRATLVGMRVCIREVYARLRMLPFSERIHIIIDGVDTVTWRDKELEGPFSQRAYTKGDQRSLNIAAASILAKVRRDRLMKVYDAKYPGYGFAQHKGYPTKAHREALAKLGPCPIHRTSFRGVGS